MNGLLVTQKNNWRCQFRFIFMTILLTKQWIHSSEKWVASLIRMLVHSQTTHVEHTLIITDRNDGHKHQHQGCNKLDHKFCNQQKCHNHGFHIETGAIVNFSAIICYQIYEKWTNHCFSSVNVHYMAKSMWTQRIAHMKTCPCPHTVGHDTRCLTCADVLVWLFLFFYCRRSCFNVAVVLALSSRWLKLRKGTLLASTGHKGHCPLIGSDNPLWHARGQSEVSVLCVCLLTFAFLMNDWVCVGVQKMFVSPSLSCVNYTCWMCSSCLIFSPLWFVYLHAEEIGLMTCLMFFFLFFLSIFLSIFLLQWSRVFPQCVSKESCTVCLAVKEKRLVRMHESAELLMLSVLLNVLPVPDLLFPAALKQI